MRKFIVAICVFLSAEALLAVKENCSGEIVAKWAEDGRTMTLKEDYVYLDPVGVKWTAPRGSIIDGASIPQFLWSLIGGPYEGRYRKASVVHDVACVRRTEPWQVVHRMFFNAMRCSGVGVAKAKAMYWAVYNCGPRLGRDTARLAPCGSSDEMKMKVLSLAFALEHEHGYNGENDISESELKWIEKLPVDRIKVSRKAGDVDMREPIAPLKTGPRDHRVH